MVHVMAIGSTVQKSWKIDLTGVSILSFDLWCGGSAYYGWDVRAELIINGNVVNTAGGSMISKNSAINTSWNVTNYSGQATIRMKVYGRTTKYENWGANMWGEIRNMTCMK